MGEPRLEDVLTEPIVLLRMRSAGVAVQDLRALCQRVRERLSAPASSVDLTSGNGQA